MFRAQPTAFKWKDMVGIFIGGGEGRNVQSEIRFQSYRRSPSHMAAHSDLLRTELPSPQPRTKVVFKTVLFHFVVFCLAGPSLCSHLLWHVGGFQVILKAFGQNSIPDTSRTPFRAAGSWAAFREPRSHRWHQHVRHSVGSGVRQTSSSKLREVTQTSSKHEATEMFPAFQLLGHEVRARVCQVHRASAPPLAGKLNLCSGVSVAW